MADNSRTGCHSRPDDGGGRELALLAPRSIRCRSAWQRRQVHFPRNVLAAVRRARRRWLPPPSAPSSPSPPQPLCTSTTIGDSYARTPSTGARPEDARSWADPLCCCPSCDRQASRPVAHQLADIRRTSVVGSQARMQRVGPRGSAVAGTAHGTAHGASTGAIAVLVSERIASIADSRSVSAAARLGTGRSSTFMMPG